MPFCGSARFTDKSNSTTGLTLILTISFHLLSFPSFSFQNQTNTYVVSKNDVLAAPNKTLVSCRCHLVFEKHTSLFCSSFFSSQYALIFFALILLWSSLRSASNFSHLFTQEVIYLFILLLLTCFQIMGFCLCFLLIQLIFTLLIELFIFELVHVWYHAEIMVGHRDFANVCLTMQWLTKIDFDELIL